MASAVRRAMAIPIPMCCYVVRHISRQTLPPAVSLIGRLQLYSTSAPTDQGDKLLTIRQVREQISAMVGHRTEWGSNEIIPGSGGFMQPVIETQDQLRPRTPSESYSQAIIPLGRDESIREKYQTFKRTLRFGRLLEDFDSMAGLLCYKHNRDPKLGLQQRSPYAFVTALVDRIEIDPTMQMSLTKDILIDGNVTWVGRSSLECTMYMYQEHNGNMQRMIMAQYLFVARNPITRKAAAIAPLNPQTPEEMKLFKIGEENKERRVKEKEKSLLKVPPSEDERLIIHDLFLSTIDLKTGTLKARIKPENSVWMEDTNLKTLIICQPEQRNLYNKIFGGFLMRKAYELAWTNGCIHAKAQAITCKTVDDIVFLKPVEIGSLLLLSSQIVYTNGPDLQVKVHAQVVKPETGEREITNDFHFTFDTGKPDVPTVCPKTYAEAMLYVEAKRHYED